MAGWLACVAWGLALVGCTAPAGHVAAVAGTGRAQAAPLSFPQLEGVYRQRGHSFVVTYQGWWLDLDSQQIRQLSPVGGGRFSYGPGWQ